MLFSPDPRKPAKEVIFSRKEQFQSHPTISLKIFKLKEHLIKSNLEQYLMKNLTSNNMLAMLFLKLIKVYL